MSRFLALALVAASLSARPGMAQTISTPGGTVVAGWGIGGLQSVGQTFIAPGPRLADFSFWLTDGGTPPVTFFAYIFAWDEASFRATGPALYVSTPQISPPPMLPTTIRYSYAPDLPVVTGSRYVAFMSATGGALASVESSVSDSYAGGSYVYTNLPPMVAAWSTYTGVPPFPPPRDLRFEANFVGAGVVVPEPSSR